MSGVGSGSVRRNRDGLETERVLWAGDSGRLPAPASPARHSHSGASCGSCCPGSSRVRLQIICSVVKVQGNGVAAEALHLGVSRGVTRESAYGRLLRWAG